MQRNFLLKKINANLRLNSILNLYVKVSKTSAVLFATKNVCLAKYQKSTLSNTQHTPSLTSGTYKDQVYYDKGQWKANLLIFSCL